ncbi:long-chain-fatty-acyl-CoA reductase [Anaerobacterium chartisolvens]|uniref:Acyl-CoA reductase n=1 Tax=Anaerobacterium chartisolvens TaxID=1297424 RepID=A0A369AP53_9FIRM|nr:acyl-CoA reductase [Anaerobacterium chartisolvens]RCX11149.1 long-chain-fatty-acyl-CoA reductase [Anaerobacterium chartisolvens]
MPRIIELPIIICGELKYPKDDYIELKYSNDITVRITRPSKEDLQSIYDFSEDINSIRFSDLAKYITNFASSFYNPENSIRKEAIELSACITGYEEKMLARDYDIISDYLSYKYNIYDIVGAELGSYRMLDGWERKELVKLRAFPRGRTFHILVGNVPMTGFFSVFRSIITKNQTVVKLPSRDIVTTLYFAKGLIEANNGGERFQEMLNKSLSVFYLERDDDTLSEMIEASDMICAWGKGESLKMIKEKIPHSIPYLEFGPKRSYSVLYTEDCNFDKAAIRMAHDLCVYDQEACLSPQRLFIIGDYKAYLPVLEKWLNWQSECLRRGVSNKDVESHIYRIRMEAKFRKWQMTEGEDQWRIIVCDPLEVNEHPLGRTLFVHPVKSESEILPFIDDETQCISVYPYEENLERLGDIFCAKGASKICETGMSFYPREGWSHDAMYPLHYFVRLCYIDCDSKYEYKYDTDEESVLLYVSQMFGHPDNLDEVLEQFQ